MASLVAITREDLDREVQHMRDLTDTRFGSVEASLALLRQDVSAIRADISGINKTLTTLVADLKWMRIIGSSVFLVVQALVVATVKGWI